MSCFEESRKSKSLNEYQLETCEKLKNIVVLLRREISVLETRLSVLQFRVEELEGVERGAGRTVKDNDGITK